VASGSQSKGTGSGAAEIRKKGIEALTASGTAIETFLGDVFDGTPKRRGFKRGIFTSLSYFVAHESDHRGNILLTIKQCGHNIDANSRYAIWAWDQV